MPKYDVWVRHEMDKATHEFVARIGPAALDVFEVSGNAWSDIFPFKSYTSSDYPQFDICTDCFDKKYDLIIAEQVFEHIRYPGRAARNVWDGLRVGGYALITVPCLFHLHPTPLDAWRWTPQGLAFLLEDAGFDIGDITTAGWGNIECFVQHATDTSCAPAYDGTQSLRNTAHLPIVVWGFARKT
jgi:SAM-dependent methyltransferase